jgi:hypothetical protein
VIRRTIFIGFSHEQRRAPEIKEAISALAEPSFVGVDSRLRWKSAHIVSLAEEDAT